MESTAYKSRFLSQTIGSGGMSLAFNEAQFAMFIQFHKQQSSDTLSIRKAATIIGKQRDDDVWVMGEGMQIDAHVDIIPAESQAHTWLEWSVQQGLGNISLKEVLRNVLVLVFFTELFSCCIK